MTLCDTVEFEWSTPLVQRQCILYSAQSQAVPVSLLQYILQALRSGSSLERLWLVGSRLPPDLMHQRLTHVQCQKQLQLFDETCTAGPRQHLLAFGSGTVAARNTEGRTKKIIWNVAGIVPSSLPYSSVKRQLLITE